MGEFDEAAVAAEIRAEFDAYEAALQGNDVAALSGFFWQDPRAVRLSGDGGLYGYDEIAAFRRGRDTSDVAGAAARRRGGARRGSRGGDGGIPEARLGPARGAVPALDAAPRGLADRLGACEPDLIS
jgi:hypothetical protein